MDGAVGPFPLSLVVRSIEEMKKSLAQLIPFLPHYRLLCFYGEMGSGKTTSIKMLLSLLSDISEDTISSPTFSYHHQYQDKKTNEIFNHFDLYRLQSAEQFYQIGLDEYLYSDQLCFIEWADRLEPLLPKKRIDLFFTHLDGERRKIEIDIKR